MFQIIELDFYDMKKRSDYLKNKVKRHLFYLYGKKKIAPACQHQSAFQFGRIWGYLFGKDVDI